MFEEQSVIFAGEWVGLTGVFMVQFTTVFRFLVRNRSLVGSH